MLFRSLSKICSLSIQKQFHTGSYNLKKYENAAARAWRILVNDFRRQKDRFTNKPVITEDFPSHVDVVVIGGAAVGSSVAYWLKEKSGGPGLSVAVIEKDPTYAKCSTVLSMGGLRQQFSLPENIQMSIFGAEFMRTLKRNFGPDADVFFTPNGYLMMASEKGAQQMLDNAKIQKDLGAVNKVLGKVELKRRFPWLNVEDIELGCLGIEKEGWFDPWALLCLFKKAAISLGTTYVKGEVVDFVFENRQDVYVDGVETGTYEGTNELVVKLPNGELKSIHFSFCVLAAGGESGNVAKLAKIGTGEGLLSVPLPVENRKRYVYNFECQGDGPGINTPLTIDYTGTYFRRDGLGGTYLGGLSPDPHEEPPTDSLEVDHSFFDNRVWPNLAHRVPAFNGIKVRSSWAGYYDFNTFDENGIIGPHVYYFNLILATGFSGHGIQQAPAVGRAVAELILDGNFQTIDLTRLGFTRLITDVPMYESCIV